MRRKAIYKVCWLNSVGNFVTARIVGKTTFYRYTKHPHAHVRLVGDFYEIIHICEIYE